MFGELLIQMYPEASKWCTKGIDRDSSQCDSRSLLFGNRSELNVEVYPPIVTTYSLLPPSKSHHPLSREEGGEVSNPRVWRDRSCDWAVPSPSQSIWMSTQRPNPSGKWVCATSPNTQTTRTNVMLGCILCHFQGYSKCYSAQTRSLDLYWMWYDIASVFSPLLPA